MRTAFIIGSAFMLMACGDGSGSSSTPPVVDTPPPQAAAPDFSQIQAEIDRHSVDNMALMIGDKTGVLFSYEKGNFRTSDIVNIASATKLITGLGVWSVIESGQMTLTDNPQDYLAFWSDDMMDARSEVTLSQLLAFTSGFNNPPTGAGCQGDGVTTLQNCVFQSYTGGTDSVPGTAFSYGPEHMQIAALMVREATGQDLKDIIRANVFTPAGVTIATGFRDEFGDNPRYSGGMLSSADEYAKVLTALLAGNLLSDQSEYLLDRTAGTQNAYILPALENTQLDWHYGFGFWKECDAVPYQPSCDDQPTISSPGAFGFLPWIDFREGYWAILAMKEPIGMGQSPTTNSIQLEQILQPMIAAELD